MFNNCKNKINLLKNSVCKFDEHDHLRTAEAMNIAYQEAELTRDRNSGKRNSLRESLVTTQIIYQLSFRAHFVTDSANE